MQGCKAENPILTSKDIKVARVAKLQSCKIQILTSEEIKVAKVAKLQNPNFDLFEDIKVARVAKLQNQDSNF